MGQGRHVYIVVETECFEIKDKSLDMISEKDGNNFSKIFR